jgi:hypothetical protein
MSAKGRVSMSKMEEVGSLCENAYDLFYAQDFRYGNRSYWPIWVVLMQLKGEAGAYAAMKEVPGYGLITISIDVLPYPDRLKASVGHEFLHLVQDLYDPRPWEDKIENFGPRHWLDEATACYSEELFSDNPETYVPLSFNSHEFKPLDGMHKEGDDAGYHGYGMSAMIKYLTGRFPSSTVFNYYTDISNEYHPVETVIARSNGTTDWLGDFFREYVQGNVYGVQAAYWNSRIRSHQVFTIATAADTAKKFDYGYEPMGARLYMVDLDYTNIGEGRDISFTLAGQYDGKTEVSVFKYKAPGEMELLDHSTTGVIVEDVKDLVDSGYDLFALVTNGNLKPPYTDDTNIRLAVRLQGGLDPTGCAIIARDIDCRYKIVYPDTTSEEITGTHGAGFPKEQGAIVEFTGTTLIQMHDHIGNDGNHYVGTMTVTFDAAFQNVATFSAQSTISRDDWTITSTLSGKNIPLEADGATRIFAARGPTTCGNITGMTYIEERSTYTQSLIPGWSCNNESEIEVWLFTN